MPDPVHVAAEGDVACVVYDLKEVAKPDSQKRCDFIAIEFKTGASSARAYAIEKKEGTVSCSDLTKAAEQVDQTWGRISVVGPLWSKVKAIAIDGTVDGSLQTSTKLETLQQGGFEVFHLNRPARHRPTGGPDLIVQVLKRLRA